MARAVSSEIRRLYANNILIVDGQSEEEMDTLNKKLEKLQDEMDRLKALGIKYCECEICQMPFYNELQRIQHKFDQHMDRFHGHGSRHNV